MYICVHNNYVLLGGCGHGCGLSTSSVELFEVFFGWFVHIHFFFHLPLPVHKIHNEVKNLHVHDYNIYTACSVVVPRLMIR